MFVSIKNIFILTGAGISEESGIPTFRGVGGLWNEYKMNEIANPATFHKYPELVWKFYYERIDNVLSAQPNEAHYALEKLERTGEYINIITQNVDNLHEKAGSKDVIHMHGEILKAVCPTCGTLYNVDKIERPLPHCKKCGNILRPNVVWFGENPKYLDKIYNLLTKSSVFISVGTSGIVFPASEFYIIAERSGAKIIFINTDKLHVEADQYYLGKAGVLLPRLVDKWIEDGGIVFS